MFNKWILILSCLTLFLMAGCDEVSQWPAEKFNQIKWHETAEENRYPYAKSIVSSRILENLTKQQLYELLGEPSSEDHRNIGYVVKVGGSGFDQIFILDVRLNEEDRVERYFIRGD